MLHKIVFAGCLLMGTLRGTAEPGCVLHLDFEGDAENRLVCRETGVKGAVTGQIISENGAFRASPFGSLSFSSLPGFSGREELSVSAWIAPAKAPKGYETILYKGKRDGDRLQQTHFLLSLFDGRPEFKFKYAEGNWSGILRTGNQMRRMDDETIPLAKAPQVPPLRWSHLAATFDRGRIRIFLDGKQVLSARGNQTTLVPSPHPLRVGEAQSSGGHKAYQFDGLIDDVRVCNDAWSPDEVAVLYRQERAAKPGGQLQFAPCLPSGYDPEFKTSLALVSAREKALDARKKPAAGTTAGVQLHAGVPLLHINRKPTFAMAMMPEPYVADVEVTKSCRDFAAADIDLFSIVLWSWKAPRDGCDEWWLGPGRYDFEPIDRRIRAVIDANPGAMIMPRIKLNPPDWWLKQHPDDVSLRADGVSGRGASLASRAWEAAYERMLRDVIRHIEGSDYADHIFGYHPAGGGSSEWYWHGWGVGRPPPRGKIDYCPAAVTRFRQWLREEYPGSVEVLRRVWSNPEVTFETAGPPSAGFRDASEHGLFRDPCIAGQVLDYRRFLCDMISSNIARSCRIVKEETGRKKLAGVFYGYSAYCLEVPGYQGLREVLDSPDVDFLCSPTAYDRRHSGEPGVAVSAYNGSYRLRGKIFWEEVDTRTHLYPETVSYRMEDLAETHAVHHRAVGHALTRGTGLWWFLLAGNATFHQNEIMADIANLKAICDANSTIPAKPTAEVAVFVDEESVDLSNTNPLFRRALRRQTLDELTRMGAPFDLYLVSDLLNPRFPDYKLYVFLNAFRVSTPIRDAIDAKVKRGGRTAAWVYAPGYVTENGFSTAAMQSLTGMAIEVTNATVKPTLTLTGKEHPIIRSCKSTWAPGWSIGPVFSVADKDSLVLGHVEEYNSLVVKEFETWRSVYSLLPLRRALLLGLCRSAGVHVYSETFDVVTANERFVMLHTVTAGEKTIALPKPCAVTELITGIDLGDRLLQIRATLPAGVTRIYRLE